ncbi:GW dipeptide domain-containing protein [Vagococcus zengguangii]|uniref:GW dipeptide domain-containing protein n=1 Tax=Vagococcus zengguangii TaxID=2571750 RepID=UPI0011097E11|nr:GW dipeptide domain-containing protein [Vagococcus zengguangii]TLG80924.1 hypothetical protein FE258_03285 [Vagococcus zengguangii]
MKNSIVTIITSLLISSTVLPLTMLAEEITSTTSSEKTQTTEVNSGELASLVETSTIEPVATNTNNSETSSTEEKAAESSSKQVTETSPTQKIKKNVTSKTPHPEVQSMLEALTPADLANAVGADGTGAEPYREEAAVQTAPTTRSNLTNTTTNVNQYIANQNFANPVIERDQRYYNLPKYYYKNARPIGVVVHETANPKSTIMGEVDYMYNNYYNAFVHAFVDKSKVVETAPTEYLAWGAGPNANPYYFHIELVRESSLWSFAKSVNNNAYWIALQLYQWGLTPSLADINSGKGTVISHHAVSNYLGGTNHVDPTGYFSSWNYDMKQFFALIQTKYNMIKARDTRKATIQTTTEFNSEMLVVNGNYYLYTNPYNTPGAERVKLLSNESPNGSTVTVKKALVTSAGTKVYLLSNGLYVDQRALKPKATVVTEEAMNKIMRFKDTSYYLYNKPYNTVGFFKQHKANAIYHNKQQVKVIAAIKTSQNVKIYKLADGYYVDQRALGELAKITTQIDFSELKAMRVEKAGYNVYTQPYNTEGMRLVSPLSAKVKVNDTVYVSKEVRTSDGINTYYIKDIGWVDARSLVEIATYQDDIHFSPLQMRIKANGYNLYSNPYHTENWSLISQLKNTYRVGAVVKVTRYGKTNEGVKTYYIEGNGWVDYRALKDVATFTEETFKSHNMRIKSNNYNLYSSPYQTNNWSLISSLNTKYSVNEQIRVTRYGTTSDGVRTYYIENAGWVDFRALKEVAKFQEDISFKTQTMKIKNSSYNLYSAPYNTNNSRLLSAISSKYKNGTKVQVTRYGTTNEGVKTYYIKNVGWVDYRSLIK